MSENEKDDELLATVSNLNINELLEFDRENQINELYEKLVEKYNNVFYNSIKKYNINYRELYLDILDIEYNNKEKELNEFLNDNFDNLENVKMYTELYSIFIYIKQEFKIYDFPLEILMNTIKTLNYIEIKNLCKTNHSLSYVCETDNWYHILKLKYPIFLEYLEGLELEESEESEGLDYESLTRELDDFYIFFLDNIDENFPIVITETVFSNTTEILKILFKDKRVNKKILKVLFDESIRLNRYKILEVLSQDRVLSLNRRDKLEEMTKSVENNDLKLFKILFKFKRKGTYWLNVIMELARKKKNEEMFRVLINSSNKNPKHSYLKTAILLTMISRKSLLYAVKLGLTDTIKKVISDDYHKVNIHFREALLKALLYGRVEIASLFLEKEVWLDEDIIFDNKDKFSSKIIKLLIKYKVVEKDYFISLL